MSGAYPGMKSLNDYTVMTSVAVHDLENARDFYENILGLKCIRHNSEGVVFESGGGILGIYESTAAGTSQSTVAWWRVDDVEGLVGTLKSKGIIFEKKYDLPHAKRNGEIYAISKDMRAAWFKDPDGNVLGFGNY